MFFSFLILSTSLRQNLPFNNKIHFMQKEIFLKPLFIPQSITSAHRLQKHRPVFLLYTPLYPNSLIYLYTKMYRRKTSLSLLKFSLIFLGVKICSEMYNRYVQELERILFSTLPMFCLLYKFLRR